MNHLEGKRVYLSGPIEHGTEENWRIAPTKVLVEEFKVNLFDPYLDPKQQRFADLMEARKNKDYDKLRDIAQDFVSKDLSMVNRSDFLIAYLPRNIPTAGTVHEIVDSVNDKKPVLLVCPEGKEFIPFWYYGFIRHTQMFGNWEDLYQYLREVNEGKHRDNYRWDFICGLI